MARPREFDEEEVIAKATEAFWAHGYDATSVNDLMGATRLAKGSLYKGFGGKKNLFMQALSSYLDDVSRALLELDPASSSGREAIERYLSGVVGMSTGKGVRRGCLAVNASIELGPHDSEVRNRLRRFSREKERTLAAIVRRGSADGSLRKDLDPRATARHIITLTDGLQVRGKLGFTSKEADETIALAISALV